MERLLLLDADVIIWLNQAGLWDSICAKKLKRENYRL